ncbi:MAG: CHASE2 domain-containing protein [Solirubrobacteraceae bacterium]
MGRAAWRRRKTTLLIGVAAVACALGLAASATHLFRRPELQTIDARFSIRGRQHVASGIVLVRIDHPTLQEFSHRNLATRIPLPRSYDAKVIERLRQAGAKAIAVDIEFGHPSRGEGETPASERRSEEESDELFEAVGRAHGKVVLAATEIGPHGQNEVLGGAANLREVGARAGAAIFIPDSDGTIRRLLHSYSGLPTLGVATAEVASGQRYSASLFESDGVPIDFLGPPPSFEVASFSNVMLGQTPPSLFKNKIVIVGASDPLFQDVHHTAVGGGKEMAGMEIWANATSTLLRGIPLRDAPGWLEIILIVLMGVVVPLGSLRLRPRRSLLSTLALAVVFTIAVQVAFNKGLIFDFVYPMFALALGTLGTLAVLYLITTIERERVHNLFSRFVPADVVDQVVASAGEDLRLGGVELDCTILFSDLRGFTSFSENQPATRVIEVVNCYLNEMTEAILAAGGTLIAYMGDGIMAAFGAPLEQDDHADRALRAAREMIGTRLDRFNAWLAAQGHESGFAMGVGLNSGPVMAGNVGAEQRVEYTTIGDTTNTASRLEGMTKGSGHMLFMAGSTRDRLRQPPDDLLLVGEFEIRGRTSKLPVWTITHTA